MNLEFKIIPKENILNVDMDRIMDEKHYYYPKKHKKNLKRKRK